MLSEILSLDLLLALPLAPSAYLYMTQVNQYFKTLYTPLLSNSRECIIRSIIHHNSIPLLQEAMHIVNNLDWACLWAAEANADEIVKYLVGKYNLTKCELTIPVALHCNFNLMSWLTARWFRLVNTDAFLN